MTIELTAKHGGAQSHIGSHALLDLLSRQPGAELADDQPKRQRYRGDDQRMTNDPTRVLTNGHNDAFP